MEKILATTDFSAKSRAGMRFAIQLALKMKAELVFLNIHQVLRASFWSDAVYEQYIDKDRENCMQELDALVKLVYRGMKLQAIGYTIAVYHNLEITKGIIAYAQQHQCSYICISTRGVGVLRKVIGTHASALITSSPIPVLCVPSSYRVRPIDHILYASDMEQYREELAQVVPFVKAVKAKLELLHFYYQHETMDAVPMKAYLKEKFHLNIKVSYLERNTINPVLYDIREAVGTIKPALLVLFTNPKESFFEKFFLPGNAKRFSYKTPVPLLSFNKHARSGQ